MRKRFVPLLAVIGAAAALAPSSAMAGESKPRSVPAEVQAVTPEQPARHCTSNQENIPVTPKLVICGSYVLVTDPESPRV